MIQPRLSPFMVAAMLMIQPRLSPFMVAAMPMIQPHLSPFMVADMPMTLCPLSPIMMNTVATLCMTICRQFLILPWEAITSILHLVVIQMTILICHSREQCLQIQSGSKKSSKV
jgi:hypothetical protein